MRRWNIRRFSASVEPSLTPLVSTMPDYQHLLKTILSSNQVTCIYFSRGVRNSVLGCTKIFWFFPQNFEDSDFFEDFLIFTISPMLNLKRFFEIFCDFLIFLWFFEIFSDFFVIFWGVVRRFFWDANPSSKLESYMFWACLGTRVSTAFCFTW